MRQRKISRRDFLWGGLIAGLSAVHLHPAIGSARTDLQPALPPKAAARLAVEGQPSATALGAAMHRAAHQLLDIPKILDDPLALRIIGTPAAAALREKLGWYEMNGSLRAFIVLRSRYAEDELSRAMDRGNRQYVILGAGLDTFAYRNPHPASRLRVFEVDHPATQSWKRARLREEGIAVPASMAFAPVDFERQTRADGLARAGFRPEAHDRYFRNRADSLRISGSGRIMKARV